MIKDGNFIDMDRNMTVGELLTDVLETIRENGADGFGFIATSGEVKFKVTIMLLEDGEPETNVIL